jgi:hypothetical protein
MKSLRKHLIEVWYFFLVPGIGALVPWRLAWRWLHWWAQRSGGPFDEAAQAAIAVAPQHLPVANKQAFVANSRLVWLIDYCDFMLSLMHWRRAWYPWHVQRVGAWPREGAFVATGFHHGAAYWLFRTLAEAGHDCTTISIRWDREEYRKHPVRYWYGRLRYWDMKRIGRRPIAYRPGIKPILKQAFAEGAAVLSLVDLPPRMAPRGQRPVRLLGHDLSFAEGIVVTARDAGVPIVPFWVEFDKDCYTRRFCIGEPLDPADIDATLQTLADILDRQIRSTPEAWSFWPELPRWIEDAERAAGSHATADAPAA